MIPSAGQERESPVWKRAAVAALVLLAMPPLLLLSAAVVPFRLAYRLLLRLWVQFAWVDQGRSVLLVYSRSPVWSPYIEVHWMPRLRDRAVVLDWSDRLRWRNSRSLPARVFRHWRPEHDFNPMLLLFTGFLRTRRIGLYRTFHDYKDGNPARLLAAEDELFAFLDRT